MLEIFSDTIANLQNALEAVHIGSKCETLEIGIKQRIFRKEDG
jgi:hypothetical protein